MTEAVIHAPAEVTPYLDEVRRLADANRDALGFLPATAYDQAAMKGCLWVAVEGTTKKLRGYLFFGDRFPRLRVYQVYVRPQFRSLGTARTLIEELKTYGEGNDYLTITARVAAELPANKFWKGLGFNVTGRHPGGKKGRTINWRRAFAIEYTGSSPATARSFDEPRSCARNTTSGSSRRPTSASRWKSRALVVNP